MSLKLKINPRISRKLAWSPARGRIPSLCSLCFCHLPEDFTPLMMWKDDGSCAQLCDPCVNETVILVKQ